MRGITHAGIFHADDVFSTALLQIVFADDFEVERLKAVPAAIDEDIIVYDIGGGEFDHHQANSPVRKNGIPYAAFGLLWKEFGPILVGNRQAELFDDSFVSAIDNTDNGGEPDPMSTMISDFNPDWDEVNPDRDQAFMDAVDWARVSLENAIIRMQGAEKANSIVQKALEEADDPRIVVLDRLVPWVFALCEDERPLFVVFPSLRGGWNAQVVPKEPGTREARLDFPSEWLENKPEGLDFIHQGLFVIAAGDKDTAVKLCQLAITKQ